MNYRPDVLDHVYTLAHEAGHSMHSWHSNRAQPYQYAGYTIFVAEVASTVNEQLLTRHLLARTTSDRERAYYLNREIDSVRATIDLREMITKIEPQPVITRDNVTMEVDAVIYYLIADSAGQYRALPGDDNALTKLLAKWGKTMDDFTIFPDRAAWKQREEVTKAVAAILTGTQ